MPVRSNQELNIQLVIFCLVIQSLFPKMPYMTTGMMTYEKGAPPKPEWKRGLMPE